MRASLAPKCCRAGHGNTGTVSSGAISRQTAQDRRSAAECLGPICDREMAHSPTADIGNAYDQSCHVTTLLGAATVA
jgi:hypothetical protein